MSFNKDLENFKRAREGQAYGRSAIDEYKLANEGDDDEEEYNGKVYDDDEEDDFVVEEEGRGRKSKLKKPAGGVGQRLMEQTGRVIQGFSKLKMTEPSNANKPRKVISEEQNNHTLDIMNDIFNEIDGDMPIEEDHQDRMEIEYPKEPTNQRKGKKEESIDFAELDEMVGNIVGVNSKAKIAGASAVQAPLSQKKSVNFDQVDQEMESAKKISNKYDPFLNRSLKPTYFNVDCRNYTKIRQRFPATNVAEPIELIKALIKDEDGDSYETIRFFWIDMDRLASHSNKLVIYGKVFDPENRTHRSASLIVRNNYRNIFFVIKRGENENLAMEEVRSKITQYCGNAHKNLILKVVDKKYCFELNIPQGDVRCIKATFPFSCSADKIPFEGNCYKGVFGTTFSMVELTQIKRKMKGPSWLSIQNFTTRIRNEGAAMETYCDVEIEVDDITDFGPVIYTQGEKQLSAPLLKTVYISYDTEALVRSRREISGISMIEQTETNIDKTTKMPTIGVSIYVQKPILQNRADEIEQFERNIKGLFKGSIEIFDGETKLLKQFMGDFARIDPDIIVGHEINNFIDLLLTRMKENQIDKLSELSRLKRDQKTMESSIKSFSQYKIRNCTVGRLVCDTFDSSKEFLKEVDYSLKFLSEKNLKIQMNPEGDPSDIFSYFLYKNDNMFQRGHLSLLLADKIQVVQLTKQLTNVGGCLWVQSMRNQRSDRNEMLLMHSFYKRNYLLPDKYRIEGTKPNKKGGQKYKGGMVIEPKAGLQENYTLLLDFNSLYPSIIREFKLCFTTVERTRVPIKFYTEWEERIKNEEQMRDPKQLVEVHNLKKEDEYKNRPDICLLPNIVRQLIFARKDVKNSIRKATSEEEKEALDIKQLAIKLIANSIYGCLGFSSSRFYARDIASMITYYGRQILEQAAQKVNELGYEVVYGDTDSVMINSRQKNVKEAIIAGKEIKIAINKMYKKKILEIEIDGIFKHLLLHKKKKYAALAIANFGDLLKDYNNVPIFAKEVKGLDMVRRDWCVLTKDIGNQMLDLILSDSDHDTILSDIYRYLEMTKKMLENGEFDISKFVIYKELKKSPSQYKDNSQPHVNVVRRLMRNQQKSETSFVNHIIPYVICLSPGGEKGLSASELAYHPQEVIASRKTTNPLQVDTKWYANNQINNPIGRILEHVEGIDMLRVATSIGIDSSKMGQFVGNGDGNDDEAKPGKNSMIYPQSSVHYKLFEWECQSCKTKNRLNNGFKCTHCDSIIRPTQSLNILGKVIKLVVANYYQGGSTCNTCNFRARGVSMVEECIEEGCDGLREIDNMDLIANGNIHTIYELARSYASDKDTRISIQAKKMTERLQFVKGKLAYETIRIKGVGQKLAEIQKAGLLNNYENRNMKRVYQLAQLNLSNIGRRPTYGAKMIEIEE